MVWVIESEKDRMDDKMKEMNSSVNEEHKYQLLAKNKKGYSYIIFTSNDIEEAFRVMEDIFNKFKQPDTHYAYTHHKGYHYDLTSYDIIDLTTKELYVSYNNNI